MTGDDVTLMNRARPCYTKSERFTSRSVAAMAAAAWPENCNAEVAMSAVTGLAA